MTRSADPYDSLFRFRIVRTVIVLYGSSHIVIVYYFTNIGEVIHAKYGRNP